MKHLLLLCLLLIATSKTTAVAAEAPPGQIAISPSMVEVDLDENPVNGSIRMQNLKKEPVNVKVEVYNWTLDELNHVKLIPGDQQSLDRWLLISPVSFTLDPGGSQVIRYSVRPKEKPLPGEHRAIIYLSQEGTGLSEDDKKNGTVQVRFRYGMAMYGYYGSKHESAEIEGLTFDRNSSSLKAVVHNTGNIHTRLSGDFAIWKAGSFPGFNAMRGYVEKYRKDGTKPEGMIMAGSIHGLPILPGHRRSISEKIEIPAVKGSLVIAVAGTLGGRPVEKLFQ